MIPYFSADTISFGFVTIHVWGLLVALGFLAGAVMAAKRAKQKGLKSQIIYDVLGWMILSSMIFARLFHVFVYEPGYFLSHLSEIFSFWDGGMSFFGGLIGAVLAASIFLHLKHLDILRYADGLIFGLPLGIFVGRIGCFLIHDHPGTPTNFFLGIRYPDGMVRHDLGFYEMLLGFGIFLIFLVVHKYIKNLQNGAFIAIFAVLYGFVRFFFDELRILDTTYIGFTPAQYASTTLLVFGVIFWCQLQKGQRKQRI